MHSPSLFHSSTRTEFESVTSIDIFQINSVKKYTLNLKRERKKLSREQQQQQHTSVKWQTRHINFHLLSIFLSAQKYTVLTVKYITNCKFKRLLREKSFVPERTFSLGHYSNSQVHDTFCGSPHQYTDSPSNSPARDLWVAQTIAAQWHADDCFAAKFASFCCFSQTILLSASQNDLNWEEFLANQRAHKTLLTAAAAACFATKWASEAYRGHERRPYRLCRVHSHSHSASWAVPRQWMTRHSIVSAHSDPSWDSWGVRRPQSLRLASYAIDSFANWNRWLGEMRWMCPAGNTGDGDVDCRWTRSALNRYRSFRFDAFRQRSLASHYRSRWDLLWFGMDSRDPNDSRNDTRIQPPTQSWLSAKQARETNACEMENNYLQEMLMGKNYTYIIHELFILWQ